MIKALNLYAGLGGNRKLWPKRVKVTAVELDPRIAAVYQRLFPQDQVIVADAHQYLLDHSDEFDFIWSSPPCQTRSRMAKATRHKLKRYVDLSVEQQVLYLQHFFKGKWVVENVKSFFRPLIPSVSIGRHEYWSNFDVTHEPEKTPPDFVNLCNVAGKKILMEWLGIHYPENIYYGKNHCPAQILRNCVHPNEGLTIFNQAYPTTHNGRNEG